MFYLEQILEKNHPQIFDTVKHPLVTVFLVTIVSEPQEVRASLDPDQKSKMCAGCGLENIGWEAHLDAFFWPREVYSGREKNNGQRAADGEKMTGQM